MKQLILIAVISALSCNPSKRAVRAVQSAIEMRDKVAASIVVPKDSIVYKPGAITEVIKVDTVNNLIRERYYYNSKDTIERTIFDNEKSEALTRLYYESKGQITVMNSNANQWERREKWYLIAIASLITIIIINAKFKFL